MDELIDTLKDLKINNAGYYSSNSATVNDAKGNPTSNPKTVTHTSDRKGNFTDTSNGILQQKIPSNRALHVVVPRMDHRIDDRIAMIGIYSQTLSKPRTKKFVADVACGGAWVNRNPRHLIRTGRDGSTSGVTGMAVRSKPAPSPVLIGSPTIYPACGVSGSLQVGKK